MEIRQLRYFLATVRLGSVGAAAAEHFVTQPAVSLQIRKLEGELGQRLFSKQGRRLVPSEAGRALAARAEDVIRSLESLEAELHGLKQLEHGHLRVGNTDAASVYVLPDVYRAFHRRYPGVRLEITVADTRRLLDALAAGRIELATATLPVDAAGLVVRPIYREDLLPVVHPRHPLALRRGVTLRDLSREGLITYPAGAVTRRMIDAVFQSQGEVPRARMEISSPEAMKRLTQAGLGVSILPRPVVSGEIGRRLLKVVALSRARFEREIGLVYRETDALSPAARVFLGMVERRFLPGARRTRPSNASARHQKGR
jgi:DNA-binding transcriptional LysR family regulator